MYQCSITIFCSNYGGIVIWEERSLEFDRDKTVYFFLSLSLPLSSFPFISLCISLSVCLFFVHLSLTIIICMNDLLSSHHNQSINNLLSIFLSIYLFVSILSWDIIVSFFKEIFIFFIAFLGWKNMKTDKNETSQYWARSVRR